MAKGARRSLVVVGAVAILIAVLIALKVSSLTAGWLAFRVPDRGTVIRTGAAAVVRRASQPASERRLQNLAPLAKVTVSSLEPADTGVEGVADGVVDTREWYSSGQAAGAWIQLDWDTPVLVEEIDLFDRADPRENVVSGMLLFDDGSMIPVGRLPVDGTPARIPIQRKSARSLRFRIDGVEGSNAGLAEIMVRGAFRE